MPDKFYLISLNYEELSLSIVRFKNMTQEKQTVLWYTTGGRTVQASQSVAVLVQSCLRNKDITCLIL